MFDHFCEAGLPHTVVEVSREGFPKTGEVVCRLVSLLSPLRQNGPATIADDVFRPEHIVGEVSSWALDMFVREGRLALTRFLHLAYRTATWIREHVPSSEQVSFLGHLLFAAEGGLLRNRLRWATGDRLHRLAHFESQGPWCPDASGLIEQLQADLPLLDEVRADVR